MPWLATVSTVRDAASRAKGQPAGWRGPHDGARDTELVQAGQDVIPTSARAVPRERSPGGMTIASVLLALLTATSTPAGDSTGPALLDFHAEWCGPCHKIRPAVEQLIRKGYPIKTIDIDQEAQLRQRYHVDSVPTFIVVDGSGREIDRTAGLQSAAELARFYKAAAAKARPPVNSNAHGGSDDDASAGPKTPTTKMKPDPARAGIRKAGLAMIATTARPEPKPMQRLTIPSHGKPSSASGCSATARRVSARVRSSIAPPRNR